MARGSLAPNAPTTLPLEVYKAIDDLYVYLKSLDADVKIVEAGYTGSFSTAGTFTVTVKNGRIITVV